MRVKTWEVCHTSFRVYLSSFVLICTVLFPGLTYIANSSCLGFYSCGDSSGNTTIGSDSCYGLKVSLRCDKACCNKTVDSITSIPLDFRHVQTALEFMWLPMLLALVQRGKSKYFDWFCGQSFHHPWTWSDGCHSCSYTSGYSTVSTLACNGPKACQRMNDDAFRIKVFIEKNTKPLFTMQSYVL